MKTLLQQLENESLLLLYMAGELPSDDREELELLLARDGGMRAQLAQLRAAQAASFAALAQLDAGEHLRSMEPALRQVDRSILQWQVDRVASPAKVTRGISKMPVWAWSIGSTVAALLVFCIWWGFRSESPRVVSTQPFDLSPNIGDRAIADQSAPPISNGDALENQRGGSDLRAGVGSSMAFESESIGDLERRVNDDLQ